MKAAAALLVALALAGCGDPGPQAIDYERVSGGIISYRLQVHVSADGRVTASGDEIRDCTGVRLSNARQLRLQRALRAAHLERPVPVDDPGAEAPRREFRSGGETGEYEGWYLPQRLKRLTIELEAAARIACGV